MPVATSSTISFQFPRLLYIGDVPIETTVAGAALLYRLLQNYPVTHLGIIESDLIASNSNHRLSDVSYTTFSIGFQRLLNSRFAHIYTTYLAATASWKVGLFDQHIRQFQPDAILTVAHGFSWLTAAAVAEKYGLPLHLIVHDDWVSSVPMLPHLRAIAKHQFGRVYRQAQSRLCVSPYMVDFYEKQYDIKGKILYPSRAADVPQFSNPPARISQPHSALTFAYAGSINSPGYAQGLVKLASSLESSGHRLIIYASLTDVAAQQIGLTQTNVEIRPLVPSQQLIYALREEADVLFVPMSFDEADRPNMEMSFPSKLTDYTVMGLPLLVWGPDYCSAVRWAKDHPGVAEVVAEDNLSALAGAIRKLAQDPQYRQYLAKTALDTGMTYFSHETGLQTFYQALEQS
jgi:glycosyltransferase involved in cell wall biosynthesis